MSKIIKVSSGDPKLTNLLLRQTSGCNGLWGDYKFLVNQNVEKCDYWFVLHVSGLRQQEVTEVDPRNVIYISMEPTEQVLGTKQSFLDQFGALVLTDRSIKHPNQIYKCGHTWWVGFSMKYGPNGHEFDPNIRLDYDALKNVNRLNKANRVSVIVSKKQFLPGHKSRLSFLKAISNHPLAKYIDLYGGGFKHVDDKWDAIAPYKYHISLENTIVEDYWTEKLADPLLGFSLPFYSGCPNIYDYFPEKSIVPIDISRPIETADMILKLFECNAFEERLADISRAREMVLDKYNIFNLMVDVSSTIELKNCAPVPVRLDPCNLLP